MANIKSAIKRIKTNQKRRERNLVQKKAIRLSIKHLDRAIAAGDIDTALTRYHDVAKVLEKAATKGAIHRNKAARKKSRIMKKINALKAQKAVQA